MGNWHCIPSSCAEVVYQEYEPPKIRWRYSNEAWQEIIGADDYSIQVDTPNFTGGQCQTSLYGVFGAWDGQDRVQILYVPGKITKVECAVVGNNYQIKVRTTNNSNVYSAGNYHVYPINPVGTTKVLPMAGNLDNCGNKPTSCLFKVTKNGAIVYQETREFCPEIKKIPCKLSDVRHSIEIKKLPYLEKVEVVPYQYSASRQPGLSPAPIPIPQADPIPSECLNIYNNAIYVIPPNPNALRLPNATPFDSFVTQICSYPGCPPPEYQVICDCQCQTCPGDTCPIECDDHVCCYNDYGVSVAQIPKANYCGGNS